MDVQVPNGVVDIAVADEAEAVAVAKRYLSYFQGPLRDWDLRRPAPAAPGHPREPPAQSTTCARSSPPWPTPTRCWSSAAASASGMVTSLVAHRGPAHGRRGQQPHAPRRRHRLRRRRQGGPVHAAVRRLRHPAAVPVGHPGDDGRARGGDDGPGPPLLPHVRHRRQPDRAVLHDRAAQGLRARHPGHGRRQLQGAVLHRGLAHRRVRRDGPRRARSSSATATSWPPSTTPASAWRSTRRWWPACTSTARR